MILIIFIVRQTDESVKDDEVFCDDRGGFGCLPAGSLDRTDYHVSRKKTFKEDVHSLYTDESFSLSVVLFVRNN